MFRVIRMSFSFVLLFAAAVISVPLFMRITTAKYTYPGISNVSGARTAVVLGASVYAGEPSPVLAARADAAIALYRAGKAGKILVTGDNATPHYNEVRPVFKYLEHAGIPAGDILLDYGGLDTYSSMYRAIHVYDASPMIIVTQDFHLPRALYIARQLGAQAIGVEASGSGTVGDYLREIPASIKALYDIAFDVQPKYMDISVPLATTTLLN